MRNAIPPEPPLRVLIFGAGVLGSLYGARLAEAGKDVGRAAASLVKKSSELTTS